MIFFFHYAILNLEGEKMFEGINQILSIPQISSFFIGIQIIVSCLQCLFGFRLIRFWIGLVGFFAGFVAVITLGGAFGISTSLIFAALIGGLLVCLFAYKVYLAGVFIFCGFNAFMAIQTLPVNNTQMMEMIVPIISILAFLLAGYLAVKYHRTCIIVLSAVTGAMNAVNGLSSFVEELAQDSSLCLIAMIIAAGIGMAFQLLTTKE